MANIIGIEQQLLLDLIRTSVREEIASLGDQLKVAVVSQRELLLNEERLTISDLIELFGVTRHTINSYVKRELLPIPARDVANRPYWTPKQLTSLLAKKGIKTKFDL